MLNSGFEEFDSNGNVRNWFSGNPVVDRGGASAHSSQVAVQATSTDGFFQLVPVEPGQGYTLGHWTRADRSEPFARLQVNWLDD